MGNLKLAEGVSESILSPLEQDILSLLWVKKKAKVREIYQIIRKKKDIAHTSIAVMLDRLHQKNLVRREVESCRGGFRYTYYPLQCEAEFKNEKIRTAVDKLIEKFGSTAVNYFNERF